MIHTFELKKVITNADYVKLFRNSVWNKDEKIFFFNDYSERGITIKLYKMLNTSDAVLKVKVNLSKINKSGEMIHLLTPEELQKVLADQKIEKILYQAIATLNRSKVSHQWQGQLESFKTDLRKYDPKGSINLSEFYLNRIDYSVQLENLSCDAVSLYTHLCNKGDLSRFEHHNKFTSSCYQSNNSVNINIYDKVAEQKEKKREKKDLPNDRSGILRIEIQCKSDKIKMLSKSKEMSKYHLSKDDPLSFLSSEISRKIITCYLFSLEGVGKHMTLKAAVKKIQQSKYNKPKKEALEALLKAESKPNTTLDAVKEKLYKGNGRLYRSHLLSLAELDINPIIISKHSKIKSLPCLADAVNTKDETVIIMLNLYKYFLQHTNLTA